VAKKIEIDENSKRTVDQTERERMLKVLGVEFEVDPNRNRPKPFHTPSEALETHYDLLDWIDSDHGLDITKKVVLKHRTNYGQDDEGNEIPPDDDAIVEGYRSLLWETVNHNNTMFVSAHMCAQLQAMIPSFEDEPLWVTDLPDVMGTVLFEEPILSRLSASLHAPTGDPDNSPLDYWIKGFAYRRVQNQTAAIERNGVFLRINIAPPPSEDPKDDARIEQFKANDGIIVWSLFDAGEMLVSTEAWEEHGCPPMLPMPFCAIPFGPRVMDTDERAMTDLFQTRQILVTLFRLVWQYILVEDTEFSRPERRRMERAARKHKRLLDDGEGIKIRHLRRLEILEDREPIERDEHEGHTLTYRVVVKGHPRSQHYPSLGPARNGDGSWNEESHRKIWIDAHIRGPEGTPLVLKHNLDVVVR
jgi:hypothetical protein